MGLAGFGGCGPNKVQIILPQHGGVETTSGSYGDGAPWSGVLGWPIGLYTCIMEQSEEWHDENPDVTDAPFTMMLSAVGYTLMSTLMPPLVMAAS